MKPCRIVKKVFKAIMIIGLIKLTVLAALALASFVAYTLEKNSHYAELEVGD